MYTIRRQIQFITDFLAGLPAEADPGRFSEPWREMWVAMQGVPFLERSAAVNAVLVDRDDAKSIAMTIFDTIPGSPLGRLPSLAELDDQLGDTEMLWPGWIPRGLVSLLAAVPGAGKSYLALDLCRRVNGGEPFPDGSPNPLGPSPVIYVDAENVPKLLAQRAREWQMPRDQFFMLLPEPGKMIDLSQPEFQDRLEDAIFHHRPGLVVIDSLSSANSKGENSVEELRDPFLYLVKVAGQHNVALLLIHHVRKSSPLRGNGTEITLDDVRGSSFSVGQARAVLGLSVLQTGPKLDPNGPRKLALLKTNVGAYPDPLGFEFTPLEPKGASLTWKPVGDSLDRSEKKPNKEQRCGDWLVEVLKKHPLGMPLKQLYEEAQEAGFSKATLYRARDQMSDLVFTGENPFDRVKVWKLADDRPAAGGAEDPFEYPPDPSDLEITGG